MKMVWNNLTTRFSSVTGSCFLERDTANVDFEEDEYAFLIFGANRSFTTLTRPTP